MRVTTTIEGGPVATMPSDQVNAEFSHQRWTNFSGLDTILGLATSLDNAGTLTSFTRDPQGHLLSYRVGNTPASTTNHYYLLDSIGTVTGTTDTTGNRDATYYYEPFGAGTNQTGTAAAGNPMRFQGGYLDPTGWYHYGQRYYNPTIGRWSQPDPNAGDINEPKDINRYLFAGDDPINNTDPTGRSIFGDIASGVAAFAGIANGAVSCPPFFGPSPV